LFGPGGGQYLEDISETKKIAPFELAAEVHAEAINAGGEE
jgi:hypothetical protein